MNINKNFKIMGKLERNTRGLTDFCPKTSLVYIVYCYIISDTI